MTATDPVQAVAEALDALNADGWMVVPHPNTGEPMQERLPVSYLAEAAVAAARPAIEREAKAEAWVEGRRALIKALRGGEDGHDARCISNTSGGEGSCDCALFVMFDTDRRGRVAALREAADSLYGDERANGDHWHPLSVASWLRERADAEEASRWTT